MMLSGQYNTLTVSEFGAICRDTIRAEEAKFSDDVQVEEHDYETEKSKYNWMKIAEDEKYAKQVERAADILAEAQDTAEEFDMNEDEMFDLADDMYDRASSNKGELI